MYDTDYSINNLDTDTMQSLFTTDFISELGVYDDSANATDADGVKYQSEWNGNKYFTND